MGRVLWVKEFHQVNQYALLKSHYLDGMPVLNFKVFGLMVANDLFVLLLLAFCMDDAPYVLNWHSITLFNASCYWASRFTAIRSFPSSFNFNV